MDAIWAYTLNGLFRCVPLVFGSTRATLNDALFELAVKGFGAAEGITPAFPGVLLNDVVHRFIYHNESVSLSYLHAV